ncbi:MAG: PHP domain-containing protein [Candidatus Omnitrophica bacterium]|nr:PHP domain-containing protein [Candidatus Omnitrophota bacterium]
MPKIADLHMHKYYSDCTDSPEEIVADAAKAQLACIAVTDHDTIDGVGPAVRAALARGIEVVPGIELSSEIEGKDVHVLGYFIDYHKGPLVEKCGIFLDARVKRMTEMISKLKALGINNVELEEVCALTKSRAVGRPHLAQILMEKGWVGSLKEAFEKYIGEGRPGYASKFKQTPFEAIDIIHQSGGLAVMAHPMLTQKDELISRLAKAGLDGLEVYYPNCSDTVTAFYEGLAKKHKLLPTGGSDAHGKAKPYTHVGKTSIDYALVERMKAAVAAKPK